MARQHRQVGASSPQLSQWQSGKQPIGSLNNINNISAQAIQHSNSHHAGASSVDPQTLPREPLNTGSPGYHSRNASLNRGRLQPSQTSRTASPQANSTSRGAFSPDLGLDRKPSLSYGHHRQTSIVDGVQHSRNTSLSGGTESSPISPEIIAAAGGGVMPPSDPSWNGANGTSQDLGFEKTMMLNGTLRGAPISSTIPEDSGVETYRPELDTQRKVDRMHSVKARREHNHHPSHSKQYPDLKTPSEYALHHLFTSFLTLVEPLIYQCTLLDIPQDGTVEQICGPGAEPKLDQLISALGHIFRDNPKPLIDTIMVWRKEKSEAANLVNKKLQTQLEAQGPSYPTMVHAGAAQLLRRNTEPNNSIVNAQNNAKEAPVFARLRQEALIADKKATAAVYVICRVLIEVYTQSSLQAITIDMAEKLEDIVFSQLTSVNPDKLVLKPLQYANWTIYTQVLGKMSELNFESVSKKFCGALEKYHQEYNLKNCLDAASENKMEWLIKGMNHIKLQIRPESAWDSCCEYVYTLGKFFADAHGKRIKEAYCQTLQRLLLWVASNADQELKNPKWKIVLDTLKPRLSHLLTKQNHGQEAFSLWSILLCVSPKEAFASQWYSTIMNLASKLKGSDRMWRRTALESICRLVWTYIYKFPDSPATTIKRLDEILRLVLPTGRKTYLSTESTITKPLVQLVRIIGFKYQDFCFKSIIFPLINSEIFSTGKDLKVEQLEPERVVISIRAFLAVMSDIENGVQPPYPKSFGPYVRSEGPMNLPIAFSNKSNQVLRSATLIQEDRLSRPMNTSRFSDVTKAYYNRFCEVLGKVTILCDNTFGGQATLDEKFGATSVTPKTPISDSFVFRRDEHAAAEQKQGFYDLFHVAVQALPRCLSVHTPLNSLINLLCTGTAHVHSNIAISAAESLKSIARQFHAQPVTIGFARFIFKFDMRYSTMSDEGLLGPGHIENTLKLYVELLQIWIDEIKQRTKEVSIEPAGEATRGMQLDISGIFAHVDEIECHGFFFLCSQSRRVRTYAITVLRLIQEFDKALGKDNTRIIQILEGDPPQIMTLDDEQLSVAERSRLQKAHREDSSSTLIELCTSDVSYDSTLWYKLFPNVVKLSFEMCPFAMALSRKLIGERLEQMQKIVSYYANAPPGQSYPMVDAQTYRNPNRPPLTSPEVILEQWKLYLVMACTTTIDAGGQSKSQLANSQHARKTSKGSNQASESMNSARSVFTRIIPLLPTNVESIREAIVAALSSVNITLYRTLLESLQYVVIACNEEAKVRIGVQHRRTPSTPRKSASTDLLRTEVCHVYRLTSRFLREKAAYEDDWILTNLTNYTNDLRIFLSDANIQNDWEFARLRRHFCGLVEELYNGICRRSDSIRWMPFESRKSAFTLMEDWCGFSPNQDLLSKREEQMKQIAIAQQQENGEKISIIAAIEIEKKHLRSAALSAMASLCHGPIAIKTESGTNLGFDVNRIYMWLETIFSIASDRLQMFGRRAFKNLIISNMEYQTLLERCIEMCYTSEKSQIFQCYFQVVVEVLTEHEDYPLDFWKALSVILFTLGNEKREVRMKSARLLRLMEERRQKNSRIQDFDISISDKTKVVYKQAQYETSKRLALHHADIAFYVVSEFCLHFRNLEADHQRNMIVAILPWVKNLELQLDPNGGVTPRSFMILTNFLEITVKYSSVLHNEVQSLWMALATGPYGGNVQLILDFIINLCLDRKEQNFIDYGKQIIVYLSSSPAGSKLIDFLLLQITPKNMVQDKKDPLQPPPIDMSYPYRADLSLMLPVGNKQPGLSLGQVSLILLVDLMVAPIEIADANVPKLLQVVFVLWDHYIPTVQEQAREMLVHLIHELVISRIDDEITFPNKKSIEDLVEEIRRDDNKVIWSYEENNGKGGDENDLIVPPAMEILADDVVNLFNIAYPNIREKWSEVTLGWATACPVRHLACRSFQIFRCISNSLTGPMLADMLVRLSNTIAAEDTDIQTFSMEILATLKTIIGALMTPHLLKYPQLFWATCACLNTVHEREFLETLVMLEKLLEKLDFSDPTVIKTLKEKRPPKWDGPFEGIQMLLYKGLRSSTSVERTWILLEKLALLPNDELIGDQNRILFTVLGNLPRFLHQFDVETQDGQVLQCVETLARVADAQGFSQLSQVLDDFKYGNYRTGNDFLKDVLNAIKLLFFPELDYQALVFLMAMLTNSIKWFRMKTMDILGALIPEVDMDKPDCTSHGPDLIAPLLRLLQTDLCPQALGVLDHIMVMSGAPMERHHLRMSMASSHSRSIVKQYERTQSLYGIPDEYGWSIPAPAVCSNQTRTNVHAVFYTCASVTSDDAQTVGTPDMSFHTDFQEPYFVPTRTTTMRSVETQESENINDLVQKLDIVDDFFDEDLPPSNIHNGTGVMTLMQTISGRVKLPYAGVNEDSYAHLYDQEAVPILNKSLNRSASTSSFQNGFSEPRSISRDRGDSNATSPLSFSITPPAPSRPSMHSRSITSPSHHLAPKSLDLLPEYDGYDAMSDEDGRTPVHAPTPSEGSSFSLENVLRRTGSKMRRFASSREKDRQQKDLLRAQQRAALQTKNSPKVPKVPSEFLSTPESPDEGAM